MAWVLFFVIRAWLPLGTLAETYDAGAVRTGLAILTLAATLWLSEALPLAITAMLIPVLAALTGTLDVTKSFSGFAHPLIFLFLGGFGLAAALSYQKLDQWLAQHLLKIGRGSFHVTAIALFLTSALLSMWISNTATVALLLPVALGILAHIKSTCGPADIARCSTYLLLGIAYSASIGGIGTLIGTPPNAIAAANLGISFSEWLAVGLPAVVILLPVLFIALRLLAKPGDVPHFKVEAPAFQFNTARILTLAIFLSAICGWLFSAPLAALFGTTHSFDTLVAICALLLLASCRLVRWKDVDRTISRGWDPASSSADGKVLGATDKAAVRDNLVEAMVVAVPVYRHHRRLRHFPHGAIQQHRQHRTARANLRRSRGQYEYPRHRAHFTLNLSSLLRIYAAGRHSAQCHRVRLRSHTTTRYGAHRPSP